MWRKNSVSKEGEEEGEEESGACDLPTPTPSTAFIAAPTALPPRVLGDVIISLDTAARQAAARG